MGVPSTGTLPNVSDPGSGNLGYPVTGNKIIVKIGDYTIAMAQAVTASDDYGVEPVMSLGYMAPRAIVPTAARYTVSLSVVLMSGSSLQNVNAQGGAFAPDKPEWAMGTADYATALQVPPAGQANYAIAGWEFDIAIVNRDDGHVLVKYGYCVYASGTLNATANRIILTDAVFIARSRDGLLAPLYNTSSTQANIPASGGSQSGGGTNNPSGSNPGVAGGQAGGLAGF